MNANLPIASLTLAALGALTIWLAFKVIGARRASKVSLGDGGDEQLIRFRSALENLGNYAPIGLIAVALAEIQGAPWWLLVPAAALLVIARVMHGLSIAGPAMNFKGRALSMQLTLVALIALMAIAVAWSVL